MYEVPFICLTACNPLLSSKSEPGSPHKSNTVLIVLVVDESAERESEPPRRRISPLEQGMNRGAAAAKFVHSLRVHSEF